MCVCGHTCLFVYMLIHACPFSPNVHSVSLDTSQLMIERVVRSHKSEKSTESHCRCRKKHLKALENTPKMFVSDRESAQCTAGQFTQSWISLSPRSGSCIYLFYACSQDTIFEQRKWSFWWGFLRANYERRSIGSININHRINTTITPSRE